MRDQKSIKIVLFRPCFRHLQGRKALVTGGSKGIGRATTELFLKLGAEAIRTFLLESNGAGKMEDQLVIKRSKSFKM